MALLDLLGHGNSDKPKDPEAYRTDLYAMQVSALMDIGFELRWQVHGELITPDEILEVVG